MKVCNSHPGVMQQQTIFVWRRNYEFSSLPPLSRFFFLFATQSVIQVPIFLDFCRQPCWRVSGCFHFGIIICFYMQHIDTSVPLPQMHNAKAPTIGFTFPHPLLSKWKCMFEPIFLPNPNLFAMINLICMLGMISVSHASRLNVFLYLPSVQCRVFFFVST